MWGEDMWRIFRLGMRFREVIGSNWNDDSGTVG